MANKLVSLFRIAQRTLENFHMNSPYKNPRKYRQFKLINNKKAHARTQTHCGFIVTVTASENLIATRGSYFASSPIMLAPNTARSEKKNKDFSQ